PAGLHRRGPCGLPAPGAHSRSVQVRPRGGDVRQTSAGAGTSHPADCHLAPGAVALMRSGSCDRSRTQLHDPAGCPGRRNRHAHHRNHRPTTDRPRATQGISRIDTREESMSEAEVVIIGAGQAAAAVIDGLREAGDERAVLLIGNEGERPYERPGLSKEVLLGEAEADSVYIHDQAYYDDHGVQTRLTDAATGIAPASATVTPASGATVTYTDLVLATGATPRRLTIPGMDLPGVHTLRRSPDSQAIQATFGQGRRLVIIGGGWIGLEVAAAARQAGSEVTVLEAAGLPLENTLGQRLGQHFADLHTSHGVTLRTGSAVAIEGTDHATGVRVDGETLPADAVVVAVGAAPNLDLAEA